MNVCPDHYSEKIISMRSSLYVVVWVYSGTVPPLNRYDRDSLRHDMKAGAGVHLGFKMAVDAER